MYCERSHTGLCVNVFFVKKVPSHGDMNQLACLQWNLDKPQEEGGGLPVAGIWLETESQLAGS